MKVRFLKSGEGPDLGEFREGDVRDLPDTTAAVLLSRGVAEEVKDKKAQPVKAPKEVKGNG